MKKRFFLFVFAIVLLTSFVIMGSAFATVSTGADKDAVEKRYQELSEQYPEDDFSVVVSEGEADNGELSSDEQFIRDIGKAIAKRWLLSDNMPSTMSDEQKIKAWTKMVDGELNILEKYLSIQLEDPVLDLLSKAYVYGAVNQRKGISEFANTDQYDLYWTNYGYNIRAISIYLLNRFYHIPIDAKYQEDLSEFVVEGYLLLPDDLVTYLLHYLDQQGVSSEKTENVIAVTTETVVTQEPAYDVVVTPEPTDMPMTTPDPNGAIDYEVEFSGKKRVGTYTGEKGNGIPNGKGTFVSSDEVQALVYEGNWADGKPAGKGHLNDAGFVIHFKNASQGEFDRVGSFDGETVDGVPNGQGTYSAVNDEGIKWTYTGAFANGTFNGYGEQVWDSADTMPDKGTFVNGEFEPTLDEIITRFAEQLNYTATDAGRDFIEKQENLFISKSEIDPELINYQWSSSAFKDNPQNYSDHLVQLQNVPVITVADTGTDHVSIVAFMDDSGMIYMGIYMGKQIYKENDSIEETFILPLGITNQDGTDIYVCLMTLPGNKLKVEAVQEKAETTPVRYEAPEGSDRSIKIVENEVTVATGKKMKLSAEITALSEKAPGKTTLIWSSSDTGIAKVDASGNVTGTKPGTAIITVCLKDNPEVKAWTTVTVVRPVTGIKLSETKLTLGVGKSAIITATITPKDATNREVVWESTKASVASVTAKGLITALGGGDCEIIATTKDGEKTASVKVHVPTFSVANSEYTVYSKSGMKIKVTWASNVTIYLHDNGGTCFNAEWVKGEDAFQIIPLRAGKGTVTLYTEGNKDRQTITIYIDHSAVYDNQSYPKIDYDSAMRYPSSWKGDKVSFSGRVLQVMNDGNTTIYRISSKGRYDNVVYVTIKNSDIVTPVIEDDNVTVYGSYNENKTYTSTWRQSITIPWVNAERIIVK